MIDNPTNYPDPADHRIGRGAHGQGHHHHARRSMWATSWSCARSAGAYFMDMKYLDTDRVDTAL